MKELMEYCENESVLIDWIIPLSAAHDGVVCCDPLQDFIEENPIEDLAEAFGETPIIEDDEDTPSRDRIESFCQWLAYRQNSGALCGYLVSFRCAVRSYSDKYKGFSYSMGHCYLKTIYIESVDDNAIIDAIKPHVDGWIKKDMAKLGAQPV